MQDVIDDNSMHTGAPQLPDMPDSDGCCDCDVKARHSLQQLNQDAASMVS
jgi:hypothetical protein